MAANGKSLEIITNNMAEVGAYGNELNTLGQSWDLLTVLGQMSGGSTDMTTTREGFRKLTGDLIEELGTETLRIVVKDITAKAKRIIDTLNRNLFERTADIGFLATDADIRAFLLAHYAQAEGDDSLDTDRLHSGVIRRFEDYVAKYSVYSNIVLLNREGHVVAQLDHNSTVTHSEDPLLGQALTTDKSYVESFGESDLFPGQGKVLLYSYRVTDPARPTRALGVLCLCFRFQDEMQAIFQKLTAPDDWAVLSLLDDKGQVIAATDSYQLPLGLRVEMAVNDEYRIARLGSQRYIIKTIAAQGYQGYLGLSWYGHVMVPLHNAFEHQEDSNWEQLDQDLVEGLFESSEIFPEQIRFIPKQADMIQANLDRTVWNGNILSNSDDNRSFKVLLREISNTGSRTKAVFSKAIANLQRKVMTCHLNDVGFLAATAIDIMDRNLYERANDCRWWALTPDFRRLLGKGVDQGEQEQLTRILQHLNSLYTVYSVLLVYDRHGRVIATSKSSAQNMVGRAIDTDWVKRTLGLRSTQHYAVSAFDKSPFYDDRHTYIYSAAIYAENTASQVVGGIAAVFDSAPQFRAMLQDYLPRDVEGRPAEGAFAVFIDASSNVIACSDDHFNAGDKLELNLDFSRLRTQDTLSTLVTLQGRHYAVGVKASTGYREFKSSMDCYNNDVYSLVFMDLGVASGAVKKKASSLRKVQARFNVGNTIDGIEIATFSIGQRSFGIKTESIVEALEHTKLAPIPNSPGSVMGSLFYKGKPILVLNPHKTLGCAPDLSAANLQVVLVNTEIGAAGLLVEHLGEICRIEQHKFTRDSYADSRDNCVEGIVPLDLEDEDSPLLVVLNPDQLVKNLMAA